MTIRQIYNKGQICSEVDSISKHSAIQIMYMDNHRNENETELNISHHILSKAGIDELENLFDSLCNEFDTKRDQVLSVTVVASAKTDAKLQEMGY